MNWKNTTPLFLFLLMIVGGGIVGTIFVLAQQQLTGSLSDTASFTDSILSALGIAAPTTADAISFTDSLAHQLGLANQAVTSPTTGGNITMNIGNGGFISSQSQLPTPQQLNALSQLLQSNQSATLSHGIIAFEAMTTPNGVITVT
ncbi:MAG: hypothetical protein QXY85_01475, partial [Candidatus Nitrosocaldus sp.]